MKRYVVIGSGVIGSSIAHELARRKLGRITVVEKESSFGFHASGRNSGVIHSGINQKPGTIKATMCLEGSRRLRGYCRDKGVPMNQCGTLVVARDGKELEVLETLLRMGKECGVPDLEIIDKIELHEKEPQAKGIAALFSPTGATVDSLRLLEAIIDDARSLGVEYRFSHQVSGIEGTRLMANQGSIEGDYIVNCAGLYADKIAHMMDVGKEYRVIPFRGEYMELKGCDVRGMIYQPPDLRFPFLSVHLTRETDGRVLAGPSAVLSWGRESYKKEIHWKETLETISSRQFMRMILNPAVLRLALENAKTSLSKHSFCQQVKSLVSGVEDHQFYPFRSGIRAQMVDDHGRLVDDIKVEFKENSTHVLNAVSPGMTCSLAFAEYLVDEMVKRS